MEWFVPALFARDLCGYRSTNGKPNTSDANDPLSIQLGLALFRNLQVEQGQAVIPDSGDALESAIAEHLRSLRPDLTVARSRPAASFAQYSHLDAFPAFRRTHTGASTALARVTRAIEEVSDDRDRRRLMRTLSVLNKQLSDEAAVVRQLKREMPEESLLKIDISVAIPDSHGSSELAIALSSKWTLRTDRAQDCVSQGGKLVAHRRGQMPHYAVVTIEPRPSMLRILGDGSGSIDCVYHLDLPALKRAIREESEHRSAPGNWSPRVTFDRLVEQRRIRDYDDLVLHLIRLPPPHALQRAGEAANR